MSVSPDENIAVLRAEAEALCDLAQGCVIYLNQAWSEVYRYHGDRFANPRAKYDKAVLEAGWTAYEMIYNERQAFQTCLDHFALVNGRIDVDLALNPTIDITPDPLRYNRFMSTPLDQRDPLLSGSYELSDTFQRAKNFVTCLKEGVRHVIEKLDQESTPRL